MTETEVERLVVRLVGDTDAYKRAMREAEEATRSAGRNIARETRAVQQFQAALNHMSGSAMGLVGQMRAIAAIESPLGFIQASVKQAAAAEMMQSNFKVMLGSAEKSAKLTQELFKFAAETPLNMNGVQDATKLLMQFGATEDNVIPTMRMLGDVALGDQQRLMSLSLAFGQMSAAGRLMGQDLLQMINAGFNPLQEISRTSGRSMAELRDDMEKGKITVDRVKAAFKSATSEGGKFKDGMMEASKTLGGLFSTMNDDIDALKRAIGTAVVESFHLKDAVKQVSATVQGATKSFQELPPILKDITTYTASAALAFGGLAVTWRVGAIAVGFLSTSIGGFITVLSAATAVVRTHTASVLQSTLAVNSFRAGVIVAGVAIAGEFIFALAGGNRALADFNSELRVSYSLARDFQAMRDKGQTKFMTDVESPGLSRAERELKLTKELARVDKELEGAAKNRDAAVRDTIKNWESMNGKLDPEKITGRVGDLFSHVPLAGSGFKANRDSLAATAKQATEAAEGLNKYSTELRNRLAEVKGMVADPIVEKAIKQTTDHLREQLEVMTMGADAAKLHNLRLLGAQEDSLLDIQELQARHNFEVKFKEAREEVVRATKRAEDETKSYVQSLADEVRTLQYGAEAARYLKEEMAGLSLTQRLQVAVLREARAHLESHDKALQMIRSTTEGTLTPFEKFLKQQAELDTLLKAGLDTRIYDRAMKSAAQSLLETADAARTARGEVQRLDGVLAGSAEAKSRIAAYRTSIDSGKAMTTVEGLARNLGAPVSGNRDVLIKILTALEKKDKGPAIVLKPVKEG